MDYKLLRALSIFLQAGLVILLIMLLSLALFACTSIPIRKATVKLPTEAQKDVMEQRFFNEVRQQRKVVCITKQRISVQSLYYKQLISYVSNPKKA